MYPSQGEDRKALRISACVTVITGTLSIIKAKCLEFLPAQVSSHGHGGRSFQMDEPEIATGKGSTPAVKLRLRWSRIRL